MSHPIYHLLAKLDNARIHYTLARYRSDSIMVSIVLVGERVEVDVFDDGHMEISRFPGSEDIVGDEADVFRLVEENKEP